MSNEGNKIPPPSHHEENYIVIQVPIGTKKQDIEKQISAALAEQPDDIFAKRKSRELVIVVQNEGWLDRQSKSIK
jgi:hypothetical protein